MYQYIIAVILLLYGFALYYFGVPTIDWDKMTETERMIAIDELFGVN
jgi:hypothetical protein